MNDLNQKIKNFFNDHFSSCNKEFFNGNQEDGYSYSDFRTITFLQSSIYLPIIIEYLNKVLDEENTEDLYSKHIINHLLMINKIYLIDKNKLLRLFIKIYKEPEKQYKEDFLRQLYSSLMKLDSDSLIDFIINDQNFFLTNNSKYLNIILGDFCTLIKYISKNKLQYFKEYVGIKSKTLFDLLNLEFNSNTTSEDFSLKFKEIDSFLKINGVLENGNGVSIMFNCFKAVLESTSSDIKINISEEVKVSIFRLFEENLKYFYNSSLIKVYEDLFFVGEKYFNKEFRFDPYTLNAILSYLQNFNSSNLGLLLNYENKPFYNNVCKLIIEWFKYSLGLVSIEDCIDKNIDLIKISLISCNESPYDFNYFLFYYYNIYLKNDKDRSNYLLYKLLEFIEKFDSLIEKHKDVCYNKYKESIKHMIINIISNGYTNNKIRIF